MDTVEFNQILSKKMGDKTRPEDEYFDYYKNQGIRLKKKYGPKTYKSV